MGIRTSKDCNVFVPKVENLLNQQVDRGWRTKEHTRLSKSISSKDRLPIVEYEPKGGWTNMLLGYNTSSSFSRAAKPKP